MGEGREVGGRGWARVITRIEITRAFFLMSQILMLNRVVLYLVIPTDERHNYKTWCGARAEKAGKPFFLISFLLAS